MTTTSAPIATARRLIHDGRSSEFIIRELICSHGLTGAQAVGAVVRARRLGERDSD